VLFASVVLGLVLQYYVSSLTLLVGWQEGHPACKKWRGWWRWALVSPDEVAPSQTVGVSASVNLPLHLKVQKFSSGTSSPRWSRKMAVKQLQCSSSMSGGWLAGKNVSEMTYFVSSGA